MKSLDELFLHFLEDVYYVGRSARQFGPMMSARAVDPETTGPDSRPTQAKSADALNGEHCALTCSPTSGS